MTALTIDLYSQLKSSVAFTDVDVQNLLTLQPIVERHGPKITDRFYDSLGANPVTAKVIEGRVDQLKATHREWLRTLVAGDYGEAYLASRWRIGTAHVKIGLDPFWVEGVMSFIRTAVGEALAEELRDPAELARKHGSFIKICDLDLMVINLAYSEERLERLVNFTGMKRPLLENIIRLPPKK